LVQGKGIAIYDLAISETSSERLQRNLLVVDEILLECDVDLSQLFRGLPTVRQVNVKHPQLWIARTAEGRWNLASFWPLPTSGKLRPPVMIEDAQITLIDQQQQGQQQQGLPSLALRDVNLAIEWRDSPRPTEISFAKNPSSPEKVASPLLVVRGTLGSDRQRQTEVNVQYDLDSRSLQVSGKFAQLPLTADWMAWVSAFAGPALANTTLEGKLEGKVAGTYNLGSGEAPQCHATLQLSEGRATDPRLPMPVTDLSCTLHCQPDRMKISELRGSLGSASLTLQLERHGWSRDASLALGVRLENVTLEKKVYAALPAMLRHEWDKYRPTGVVDAEVQVTFDGARWRPAATLTGRDLEFESDKFRYRVQNGSGTLSYTPSKQEGPAVLDIDLVGYAGGQPIKFVGQAFDPQPGAAGWIEITGDDVEIEPAMIAALTGKTRHVIESIHPQGKINVRWRIERTEPGQSKLHTSVGLQLVNCRVNYEKFPYPLRGINGLVAAEDGRWTFRDLVSGGSRSIQCQGYLRPTEAGTELSLQFTGQQVPLDDDLQNALPAPVQRVWDELRPRGRVDLIADVFHVTSREAPSIHVSVHPQPETATIQPRFFPYLLEQIEGSFDYVDGQVKLDPLKGVRARHGRTRLHTKGGGSFTPDGAWQVQLEGLSVDHLAPRRDLLVALPTKLQEIVEQLRPTGNSFSLHDGVMTFSKTAASGDPIHSSWDVQLDCHQTDLQVGIELQNVHGSVRLQGESDGAHDYCAAELAIDTATFEDVQFTNIQGPVWINDASCLLGEWATRKQAIGPRRITADVYGGKLVGDAWVTFDSVPRYSAIAALRGADLLRIVNERLDGQQDFRGKVDANLRLDGSGRSLYGLKGKGEVKITEAQILELPLLVGLMQTLRKGKADSRAFNQCDAKFDIQGRDIRIEQLDFIGDAVSLLGSGVADLDQKINLSFYGVVGRNQIRVPVVKNFVNQLGQHTMQMYVDGTLADPQVHTQALPGINQLIQQIRSDLDVTTPSAASRNAQRQLPTTPRRGLQK